MAVYLNAKDAFPGRSVINMGTAPTVPHELYGGDLILIDPDTVEAAPLSEGADVVKEARGSGGRSTSSTR